MLEAQVAWAELQEVPAAAAAEPQEVPAAAAEPQAAECQEVWEVANLQLHQHLQVFRTLKLYLFLLICMRNRL